MVGLFDNVPTSYVRLTSQARPTPIRMGNAPTEVMSVGANHKRFHELTRAFCTS